jgi:RND family efflux transporter MFP subunit
VFMAMAEAIKPQPGVRMLWRGVAVLALMVPAWMGSAWAQAAAPARVPLTGATTGSVGASGATGVLAPGVTQAMKDIKLGMTVAGRVDGVLVREGARVRAGQVLLHLDRQTEELEVQRRRLLLQDDSRLQELRSKEVVLAEQVNALRPLLTSGAVSRKQMEDEEMALGAVVAERKALEIAKQREQVELDLAVEAFERRHLRSPIQGTVTKVVPRMGESIGAHEPLVYVVDTSRVRFVGNIPAAQGALLRVGAQVTLRLGAESGITRTARVMFVSPVADPASGLVEVIAEFDNPDGSVRPGIMGRLVL